jgi:subtilisin-like proprotein convertase family protein
MKASTRLPLLLASVLACSLAAAQFSGTYSANTNLPIPPSGSGGPGGCFTGSSNTTEFTLSVPDAFVLSHVRLELDLTHSYVGDLTLTLKHCGTSVVLYDRNPGSSSDLNGTYAFDDQAILYFANYVTTPSLVPPNTYLPVNPLTPFFGMSTGGDWTISICDHVSGDTGHLSGMSLTLSGAQTFGGTVSPPLAIPDANGVGCSAPVARAINVPTSGVVDQISVTLGLAHPYVQDLHVTVSHDGVMETLIASGSVNGNVGVQGLYTFTDDTGIVPSFVAAANAVSPGLNVPQGLYRPATPLSAFAGHSKQGVWLVTICDTQLADVGTLSFASITLSESAWDLTLTQPIGPGSLVFENKGGLPGHTFLNLATVVPGSFPNGWLNGLDISFNDIVVEVGVGAPVVGTLGSCGGAITWIGGPIPSNLPIQFVSFELDSSGTPVASKRAFQYVTQ